MRERERKTESDQVCVGDGSRSSQLFTSFDQAFPQVSPPTQVTCEYYTDKLGNTEV